MARIRTVKPELARHEALYAAECETKLPLRFAWAMFPTVCDREGRFEWRPNSLKCDVLPYDRHDFSRVLDAFVTRGFILKYENGGRVYGCIPTFPTHQAINNREAASVIPAPAPKDLERYELANACATRAPRVTETPAQDQGEGKGREGKGNGKREAHAPSVLSDAVKEWAKTNNYDHPEASLAYLIDYAAANGKRYDDWDAALRNCIKADWGKAREMARKPSATTYQLRPKNKCVKCEAGCDGIDWKGNKYCATCYGDLTAENRGADLQKLLAQRSAAA